MQLTIMQLEYLLRIHAKIIRDESIEEIYLGDHIAGIQDSLQALQDNNELSPLEKKILDKLNEDFGQIK